MVSRFLSWHRDRFIERFSQSFCSFWVMKSIQFSVVLFDPDFWSELLIEMNAIVLPLARALSTSCRRDTKPGFYLHKFLNREKNVERRMRTSQETRMATAVRLPPEGSRRQKVWNLERIIMCIIYYSSAMNISMIHNNDSTKLVSLWRSWTRFIWRQSQEFWRPNSQSVSLIVMWPLWKYE